MERDTPAFPINDIGVHGSFGLTKRELFAAMAMQGYCANPNSTGFGFNQIAADAEAQANALIAALSKATGAA